jgi:hypothetical protein
MRSQVCHLEALSYKIAIETAPDLRLTHAWLRGGRRRCCLPG